MSIPHVGVDLHKQTSQVAILADTGEITQHRLPNDRTVIKSFFRELPTPARIAIEATGTWWWIVDLLESLGHDVSLSHPKQTRAIAAARLKNDRVDAQRLAVLLRANLLPTVWIPPQPVREARELVRHRLHLVQIRTRVKNHLLALLARRNLRAHCGQSWLSVRGRQELERLSLGETPGRIVENCRKLLQLLDDQIRGLEIALIERFHDDPHVQRLQTIPGIGRFLATLLVIELGDIRRFPSAKHLVSYVGLVPRVRASGERVRLGHISKEGSPILRWALVVAATQAARQPGPLQHWHRQVLVRRGPMIARVALARRLLALVYEIWTRETTYTLQLRPSAVQR